MITSIFNLFYEFFYSFLHPFKVHSFLWAERKKVRSMPQLRLAVWGEKAQDEAPNVVGLDIVEQVGLSWFFVIVRSIYSIISINIGIMVYQNLLSNNIPLFESFASPITIQSQKMLLLYVIGEAGLYPIILWFYIKLWSVLIRFFGNLFECEGDIPLMTEQVVGHSLAGHLFLLVPIFGDVARHFSSIIYIFAGLRNNMRMTIMQSVIVVSSPLLLLVIIVLMVIAYMAAVYSVL